MQLSFVHGRERQTSVRHSPHTKGEDGSLEGKKHFKRMPMGIKNAAPAFTQMIIVLEKNWKRRCKFLDMPKYINIVIDIMRKLTKGKPVMHLHGLEFKILTELESAISSLSLVLYAG